MMWNITENECPKCHSQDIIKGEEAKNPNYYETQYRCKVCESYWTIDTSKNGKEKSGFTCCQHGTDTAEHCFLCCKEDGCKRCERSIEKAAKCL